jgi:hypothetical protein
MSLLREIQKDAVDPNVDISTLLRKCKILAARLKHKEFSKWVENELNGYSMSDELPEYRKFDVQSFGHFSGPFGSGLKNAPIPAFCLPEDLQHIANKAYLYNGISTYSSLVKSEKNSTLTANWPAEVVALYGQKIYQRMNCLGAWSTLGSNQIQGLVDTVRNRVLSFVLEIEAQAPSAGEALPSETPISKDKINQIYQTYILGDVGSVSSGGTHISQVSIVEVIQNDVDSLLDYLRSLQVDKDDIKELKASIQKDPNPTDRNSLGKNVSGWIGKMISKAASGVWKVSTSVAADILTKAILKYYGME